MPGFEDLYKEIILDHYRNPRHRGELDVPPAHKTEGFNPLCGDEVVVYIEVTQGVVDKVRIAGQGCSISQSSASMMAEAVQGKTVDEVHHLVTSFKSMMSVHEAALDEAETAAGQGEPSSLGSADEVVDLDAVDQELGDLAALRGVLRFPVRIKCATLSWNTLLEGIAEASSAP